MGLASVFLLFVRAILLPLLECSQIFICRLSVSLDRISGSKTFLPRFTIGFILVSCYVLIFCFDILLSLSVDTCEDTPETK